MKTIDHQNGIIKLLEESGTHGVNSRRFINEITPRWSARKRELVQQGFIFHTKRERLGGSNLIRVYLDYNPRTGKGIKTNKPLRYEFNNDTGTAVPIYE